MRRSVPADRVRDVLGPTHGLSNVEASARLARFGPNDILEVPEPAWRALTRETARDPMIWFLIGTAAVYAALGDVGEALVLGVSIAPLVGMDAFLHRRTQASTAGLRHGLATRARVLRDGAEVDVPAGEVVPGDLAIVTSGDPFPADGLVEHAEAAQVDESALTGESYPVQKSAPSTRAVGAGGVDAVHWGFAGTRLLTGRVLLRVTQTGRETLYGEIVRSAVLGARAPTPLQLAIKSLVRVLVLAALALCCVLALVRLRQGFGWIDAMLSAVTLAVAALPEEFPVVFTLFLGVGVYRLARRKALVRRAVSVENIGRVTSICSDKTGTLTEGVLRLAHLLCDAGVSEADLLVAAGRASRPENADPLDVAVLAAADRAGVPVAADAPMATFPFTEDRRRETGIWTLEPGRLVACTKGSPETVLALCALADGAREAWLARVDELARDAHKVIACASLPLAASAWVGGEPDRGFRFEGLLAFEDPVREGVALAVASCRRAGIHVLMITGDHPHTASAVGREIGLGGGAPESTLAEDLVRRIEAREPMDLRQVHVVARAVPAQKLAIVRALQGAGEIVAVTGDGVNDVPALQAADIGVAMGGRGTRSAREVASIVLLDDDFRTIVAAIGEGRQLFRNLQQSFLYLLLVHIPLVLSAAIVPLAGYPLLYLPIHIVLLELMIHPTALLGFQQLAPDGALEREPAAPAARFLTRGEWVRVGLVGTTLTALLVAVYVRSLGEAGHVEHARTMVLVVLVMASTAFLCVLSRLHDAAPRWIAVLAGIAVIGIVQVPTLAARLHLEPLHADDWLLAAGTGVAISLPLVRRRSRRVGDA